MCVDMALGMVNSDLAGISKGNYWNKTLIHLGGSFGLLKCLCMYSLNLGFRLFLSDATVNKKGGRKMVEAFLIPSVCCLVLSFQMMTVE